MSELNLNNTLGILNK